jgi:hypothetical protein
MMTFGFFITSMSLKKLSLKAALANEKLKKNCHYRLPKDNNKNPSLKKFPSLSHVDKKNKKKNSSSSPRRVEDCQSGGGVYKKITHRLSFSPLISSTMS